MLVGVQVGGDSIPMRLGIWSVLQLVAHEWGFTSQMIQVAVQQLALHPAAKT